MSLIPLSRANNISIMLTQFSNFRRGPQDIRRAVCAGELGPERLSLLLQVLWTWSRLSHVQLSPESSTCRHTMLLAKPSVQAFHVHGGASQPRPASSAVASVLFASYPATPSA